MNTIREIIRINEREAELGIEGDASWHAKWKVPHSLDADRGAGAGADIDMVLYNR